MKKIRMMATMCAVFLLAISFNIVAFAGGGSEESETPIPVTMETEKILPAENPFTPAGTGTVVDNATDADGKEFFTIMTPNENVFYLIIDRQREQENVYFLNAVTEKDLLALAEQSEETEENESFISEPISIPTPEAEPTPEPAPEPEKGGNPGMVVLLFLILIGGGGAGWYFKIYLPKQQQADTGNEIEDYEDDFYDEDVEDEPYGEEAEDDLQFWDMDDESGSSGEGDE